MSRLMTLTVLCGYLLGGHCYAVPAAPDAELAHAIPGIESVIQKSGADIAVAFRTLDGQLQWLSRADESFHAALALELVVALLGAAVEAEAVLETRTAAAFDRHSEGRDVAVFGDQRADLRGRRRREGDDALGALDGRHGSWYQRATVRVLLWGDFVTAAARSPQGFGTRKCAPRVVIVGRWVSADAE